MPQGLPLLLHDATGLSLLYPTIPEASVSLFVLYNATGSLMPSGLYAIALSFLYFKYCRYLSWIHREQFPLRLQRIDLSFHVAFASLRFIPSSRRTYHSWPFVLSQPLSQRPKTSNKPLNKPFVSSLELYLPYFIETTLLVFSDSSSRRSHRRSDHSH